MFLLTPLQQRILRRLCIAAGQKMNQRELAKRLGATPAGIAKALPALESRRIATVERSETMNLNLITLDRNQKTLRLKQLENLKQLYELDVAGRLEELYPGTTIILFGSYARGEDLAGSDIDLAVIGTRKKAGNLEKSFEERLGRDININTYTSWNDIHKDLKENLCNGILLAGGVEL